MHGYNQIHPITTVRIIDVRQPHSFQNTTSSNYNPRGLAIDMIKEVAFEVSNTDVSTSPIPPPTNLSYQASGGSTTRYRN